MIVRVVYDHEGQAIDREPFFFSQVQEHLAQLGTVLKRYADSVFVYQGMLVGNWGEMHTSRFLGEDKLAKMAELLRSAKGSQTYLAVRRPVQWRVLHENPGDKKLRCGDGMGLFDDGIFGSESHLGTFGTVPRSCAAWNEPWTREDELSFEGEICRSAPNGGEVVYNQELAERLTPEEVLKEFARMQLTYLNRVYDARLLDIWRQWKSPVGGVWADKSLYDYVGAHLGYRFLVRRASVELKKGDGSRWAVELEIENVGFGAFYQEAEIYLEWAEDGGNSRLIVLDARLQGWGSGEKRQLSCVVQACSCGLYLAARRRKDGAAIRFGNLSDGRGRVLLGQLCPDG